MRVNYRIPSIAGGVLLLVGALVCEAEDTQAVVAVSGVFVPRPLDTVPLAELDKVVPHQRGAEWPKDWVTTPPMPMVIRRGEDVKTASYQEVTGYTFLINSMKRPRLVRMDSGRLVLAATAWLHKTGDEVGFIVVSDDEGKSWSQPREVMHGTLINLGGKKLMIIADAGKMTFSDDAGDTWSAPEPSPRLKDGSVCYHHGSVVVEGNTVSAIFFADRHTAFLRRSADSGHTWGEPIPLPKFQNTAEGPSGFTEGALTRAADGALVVALRTGPSPGYPDYSDHWRRIITARSTDNGKTWTDAQFYFRCGKVHADLLTLPNGDILMTYATRMGELDGQVYHGIEAVLSHDHGKTWDWANRYYLFRWAMMTSMHSPQSVVLSDGRVLTVFLYNYDAPWGKRVLPEALNIGLVNAIFWSLK